ncbi:ISAs1 family transposase [Streptomyces hokutonensis]|uniref:ISAs1 family transposase n=1 Tax=Streptomyces hokutonensis TaxID=1306990 RepID=UPI00368EF32C
MPAAPSSRIPAVLAKLGPLHQHDTGRLRAHLRRVPDPRSPRGRWYPLVGLLLICACAVVSGARTITEITEWGQRATTTVLECLGTRRHLPGRRRAPSHATLTRLLAALDGYALETVIGAYLAAHDNPDAGTTGSAPQPSIAVDGMALSGSAHRQQRHRHLLSAVTQAPTVALAQREVGAKTNETAAFRPLLEPLDLAGTVVTFDALHSVRDQVRRLVQEKKAHYIAVIKGNQPTVSAQIMALPWEQVPVAHTVSEAGHGRRESRLVKSMAIAANLGGIAFPQARLALRLHRRRQESGKPQTRETVYAVTSLDPHQARLPTWADTCAGTGESKIPATMSETWCAPRTPPPSTPAARRGRWPLCGTCLSAGFGCWERTTLPRPLERSGTHPNTPSGSGASPTAHSCRELEATLRYGRLGLAGPDMIQAGSPPTWR